MKSLISLSSLLVAGAGLPATAAHAITVADTCSPQVASEGAPQVGQSLTVHANCLTGGESSDPTTVHWTFDMAPGSCGAAGAVDRGPAAARARRRPQALPTATTGSSVTLTPDSAGVLTATVTRSLPEQPDVVASVSICIAAATQPPATAPAHLDELSVPLVRMQTEGVHRELSRTLTHLDAGRQAQSKPGNPNGDGLDFFVMGLDEVLRHGDDGDSGPFRIHSEGLSAGVDYRMNAAWVFGGAIGYTHSRVSFSDSASSQRGNGQSITAFASFTPTEQFYASAALSQEWTRYALRRDTSNASGDIAEANTRGHGTGLALSVGTDATFGAWTASPYARLEWVRVGIDAFDEAGTVDAVAVTQQTARSQSFNLGGSLQTSIPTSWGVLLPQARIELTHLFGLRDGDASARLFNGNTTVALPTTTAVDRQFGNVALGLSAITQAGWTFFGEAEFGFAQAGYSSGKLSVGMRHEL